MYSVILVFHVIISILLIIAILMQSGQKADIAAVFGGSSSSTVFGPRGATTVLVKITAVLATLFIITSVSLYVLSSKAQPGSVLQKSVVSEKTDTKK
ncbi:MAG: preprotein translocase subunit SecG [Candidatus Aminicenantes bacterium]|nr:preprotein translocase subunit SecG [Candidatus Aminicenantes bacterium]